MPSTATTPLEKAQDLIYRAFDARGRRRIQTMPRGTREEGMICDVELGEAWHATPGAVDWLRAQAPARRSGKRRRR